MKLSNRIEQLAISPTRRYLGLAQEVEAAGTRVLRLSIGQPDIAAPNEYFEALGQLTRGTVPYPPAMGIPAMRKAQSDYYKKYGIDYAPEEIFITTGATEGITFAIQTLCDPGDAIMLIEPFYTNYGMIAQMQDVETVAITTSVHDNYSLPSLETFESLYSDNLRAILFANPGNPTGRVYTEEELQIIVDFALKHDLYVISDEVYREFNFTERPFVSMYDFEEIRDHLFLIDSASKKYALCGARVGSIATKNEYLKEAMVKLSQMRLGCPHAEQVAVAKLINLDDRYFDGVRELYRNRRDALREALEAVGTLEFSEPEGAFYTMIRLPVKNAEDYVVWLLKNFSIDHETVLLTPASGFYKTPGAGIDEVRVSYCVDADILRRAIHIVAEGLKEYPNN
ncbi:MAG: pyridoxal phosphate-dependent aminotransferase [Peptoniphilaceae bacterium]|nr:pyridoxal phosphate-dependent aminotransferase [Peptoniphilaceae bacterium]MDY6085926.1 pyridoxal phosphate-dependent aminotransferase [Peptoniphilaceae bacterium]